MRSIVCRWLFGMIVVLGLSDAMAATTTGTLKKIAETGTMVIGVRENQVPFAYVDEKQNFIGYTIDICNALVEGIKADAGIKSLKVEYKSVTPQTWMPLLANGAIDLDCSSVTNNAARQKQVSFSNTFFLASTAFVAKSGSNLKSVTDLQGKTVVAIQGTNHVVTLNELNAKQNLNMRIVSVKDQPEAFLMLASDRTAALVSDDVFLASSIASSKNPSEYTIAPESLAPPEPYGLVMRRDDPDFKAAVDKALNAYLASPAAKATYDKWFMQPIPPRGLKMNFPMTPALQKAYAKPTDSIAPGAY